MLRVCPLGDIGTSGIECTYERYSLGYSIPIPRISPSFVLRIFLGYLNFQYIFVLRSICYEYPDSFANVVQFKHINDLNGIFVRFCAMWDQS